MTLPFDIDAYKLLCLSSARRCFDQRHHYRNAVHARQSARFWINRLRQLRQDYP